MNEIDKISSRALNCITRHVMLQLLHKQQFLRSDRLSILCSIITIHRFHVFWSFLAFLFFNNKITTKKFRLNDLFTFDF